MAFDIDTTTLLNKDLRSFEKRINACTSEDTLSTILEDFSEHIEHTNLIDINEYKYINELIKSKRSELELSQINNAYKDTHADNNVSNNISSPAKVLTFNKGGFNPYSVDHSKPKDLLPTTSVSGNRGLVTNAIVILGVIATIIMYTLLFIGLIIK